MNKNDIYGLLESLSERDLSILESIRKYRALTTALIRRLHFPNASDAATQPSPGHATEPAASVATIRVLTRLESHRLIARLQRRIGGVRAGSSGITWQLGSIGERLLRLRHGESARRRYSEPSSAFVAHPLAVADLAVTMHELDRSRAIELLRVEAEPLCWRSFLSPHGARAWVKPDLFAITAGGDFEQHWFIEADNATEHAPVIARKALAYRRYAASGIYQEQHGVFPAVTWIVPDAKRQSGIKAVLAGESNLAEVVKAGLFHVLTTGQFSAFITSATQGQPLS